MSLISSERVRREETEEEDEVTLSERLQISEDTTRGGMGWFMCSRENISIYVQTHLVTTVGTEGGS